MGKPVYGDSQNVLRVNNLVKVLKQRYFYGFRLSLKFSKKYEQVY